METLTLNTGGRARWTWFLVWISGTLALWTGAWILHEAVFVPRGWCAGSWSTGAYWTVAKLAIWIAPVLWLIRRSGRSICGATGLGTLRGLPRGVLVALAWVGVQALVSRVRGVWPSPPRSIADYAAANSYVVAPLFEEIVFRGFALRGLRERGASFWPAALATSVAFGLLHVPGWLFMKGASAATLASFGPVVLIGIVLAAVSWRIPSLWACSAVHLANNAWTGGLIAAVVRAMG